MKIKTSELTVAFATTKPEEDTVSTGENKLPTPAELKQMAYDLKKSMNIKQGHAYELLAKQYGFNTYAAMRAVMRRCDN